MIQFRNGAAAVERRAGPRRAPVTVDDTAALQMIKALTARVLATFTSPVGIVVLAFLDSTLFFSLPLGIDGAVIILSARSDMLAWAVPIITTAGSILGAALTFWMGRKAGEKGLDRYLNRAQLDRVRRRANESGAIVLALLDLIPPPFPFTPFVLAAGALEVRTWLFFSTLVVARLFRFGLEAFLAQWFGRRILSWLESDSVQNAVFACIVLGIALTVWTLWKLFRSSRSTVRRASA
jgi:membrane protein YqaA with SNARE-associated domain